eukprot:4606274-Prorocentrum_lima.AAC.1
MKTSGAVNNTLDPISFYTHWPKSWEHPQFQLVVLRGGDQEAIMEANLHGGDTLVLTSPMYSRLMPNLDTAAMLDSWLGLMARKSR